MLHNDTDHYFVQAKLDESDGIYYVTAHVADKKDATHFIPVTSGSTPGKVIVKGLEDDTYRITEVRTDSGYTLLKENIQVVISQTESETLCGNHHLLTASSKVDGNAVTMLVDNGSANAEAPLTVVNTRGFDLPETGANGTCERNSTDLKPEASEVYAFGASSNERDFYETKDSLDNFGGGYVFSRSGIDTVPCDK